MTESGTGGSTSQALAEAVFDTVREPMLILDRNLFVLQASFSFYQHFQVAKDETVGRHVYDLGNGQWNIPELRKLLEEVLPKNHSFEGYEVRHSSDKLGSRILLLNARMIDTLGLVLLSMEDVTGRKNAEEALQRSEERYRRLFETSKDGIMIVDADDGLIIDANPFMEGILNFDRLELQKMHIWELSPFDSVASSVTAFAELQQSGYNRFENLPLTKRDGEKIDVEFVCNRYAEGERSVIQCNVRDITERKTAERQRKRAQEQIGELNLRLAAHAAELEDKNKELEAFNYSAAHDLRQPLNTIGLYCQTILMQHRENLDQEVVDSVTKIYKRTTEMDALIGALLRFSRLGHVELRREKVNLSDIARKSAENLRQAAPQRKVSLRIADGVVADGDSNLLDIALDNLFSNAWKYTSIREEAIIEFGMEEADGEAVYFVRDNGIGLPQADLDNVFIPFRRLAGAEAFKGHGIGLATVERIVQRHGGRIWAEGEPGKGATFRFTLLPKEEKVDLS